MALFVRQVLMFVVAVIAACLCGRGGEARTSAALKVQLDHGGILVGRYSTSYHGRDTRAFLRVPYAEPPIGERRFQPPEPFGAWSGERLAMFDAPKCVQRDPYRRETEVDGEEDCLYLNVYTPVRAHHHPGPLPVMVWFHGGGWMCGAGIRSFYAPDYFMDHDVVVVTANFRLGPLGFLSTETLDCPGNFGLKDQLEVLRWVHRHIDRFGGDANLVTVFGESAGGASTTYFMDSPQAKGLFHKAIAQSGTYLNGWAQPGHRGRAARTAQRMSAMLGCADEREPNWPQVLACLRAKPAKEVVATLYDLFEWDTDQMIPFPPVVEPAHDGAYITASPRGAQAPLHGHALPLLIGITSDEGLLRTAPLINMPNYLAEFKANFTQLLPLVLYYDHQPAAVRERITAEIAAFYLKNGHDYDKAHHQNLTDLISDAWFNAGVDEYLRLRLQHHQQQQQQQSDLPVPPTYVYLFEQKGPFSFTEMFQGGLEEYYGASHAEELPYLFPIGRELFFNAIPTQRDVQLRQAMVAMWVNFANSSNPTPADSHLPTWRPAVSYPVHYARLGGKSETAWTLLQNDYALYQDRMDFWHKLQPFLPAGEQTAADRDEL